MVVTTNQTRGALPQTTELSTLGLDLSFAHGKGYLATEHTRLADWLTIESLRMEIPDLSFPLDTREGVSQFQGGRCRVQEFAVSLNCGGLNGLIRRSVEQLEAFDSVELRFKEGAIYLSFRLKNDEGGTFVSAKVAPIRPEPPRTDELHLSIYDYRAYGPLPQPVRLIVRRFVTGLLETSVLAPPGRGAAFTVRVAGDIIRLRPFKLLSLGIFPKLGWKLPDLSTVTLERAEVEVSAMVLEAASEVSDERRSEEPEKPENKRAAAAYEAKSLFSAGDEHLFQGEIKKALREYNRYFETYGAHPELVRRRLDCLLAGAESGDVVEIEAICRELGDKHPLALNARMVVAGKYDNYAEQVRYANRLLSILKDEADQPEWIMVAISVAQLLSDQKPRAAIKYLRRVLEVAPQHQIALQKLRRLYKRVDEYGEFEETLKRLTAVTENEEELADLYLELAAHLMEHEGALGVEEAVLYLEKVLDIDDTNLEAYRRLGECYVKRGKPVRAVRVFETASRLAGKRDRKFVVADVQYRLARIWEEELEDLSQAKLNCQRALMALEEHEFDDPELLKFGEIALYAAELSTRCGQLSEAIKYWQRGIDLLSDVRERLNTRPQRFSEMEASASSTRERVVGQLTKAHRELALLYEREERFTAACEAWRAVLDIEPYDQQAFQKLEKLYQTTGQADKLIQLYKTRLGEDVERERKVNLHDKIANIYEALDHGNDASRHRQLADAVTAGDIDVIEVGKGPDESTKTGEEDGPVGEDEGRDESDVDLEGFREEYESLVFSGPGPAPDSTGVRSDSETEEPSGRRSDGPDEGTQQEAVGPDERAQQKAGQFERVSTDIISGTQLDGDSIEARIGKLRNELEKVRRGNDDPQRKAQLLAELLEFCAEGQDRTGITTEEFADLSFEMGEVCYYELEDADRALPYLERARKLAPDEYGDNKTLLTTLENIYEKRGDVQRRIEVLEKQLERAETRQMKNTYQLLLAQLVWREFEDGDRVRRRLEPVLEVDPDHEAAHRLLVDVAMEEQAFEAAAEHMETVIDVSAAGLDVVEMTKQLADLLLDRLDAPGRALHYYRQVLTDAPADSSALEGLKKCQASQGDWEGFVDSLAHEFGLLVGELDLSFQELLEFDADIENEDVKISASDILGDVAHIVETEQGDPELAHKLWGKAIDVWPDDVDALKKRVELDRQLGYEEYLARDLEQLADALLDADKQASNLLEASRLWLEQFDHRDQARRLLAKAAPLTGEIQTSLLEEFERLEQKLK